MVFTDLDSPFGVPHLFELLGTPGCQVVAVVIGAPGPSETGGVMRLPDRWGRAVLRDVLKTTTDLGVPVLQVPSVRDGTLVHALEGLSPDLLVSAGFRRILPREVLNVPACAAVNLHPSRLPRVRGRSPWFWTVATGETETAATLHHMVEEVDAGDIVFQVRVGVDANDTASSLQLKTTLESLRLIAPLIEAAAQGPLPRHPQNLSDGAVFSEPSDRDRMLDWSAAAGTVHRLIRASLLTPGAHTRFRERGVRVLDAELGTDPALWATAAPPGAVLKATTNGVAVKAGDGHVVLRRLEYGGQPLPAASVVGLAGGEGAHDRFC